MPADSAQNRTDRELVSATLAGDRTAFRVIVERHGTIVLAYLIRHTGSAAVAEDLAQEVFLAAYQHLGRLRDPDTLRSWLVGIGRNKVREWRRAVRRDTGAVPADPSFEAADAQPGPDERASRRETFSVVTEIVNGMSPKYKPVVWMRLVEELSFRDIAERLNVKEGTARMRFGRGASILRKSLRRRGFGTDTVGGTSDE